MDSDSDVTSGKRNDWDRGQVISCSVVQIWATTRCSVHFSLVFIFLPQTVVRVAKDFASNIRQLHRKSWAVDE